MVAGGNERLCLELIRRAPVGVEQALVTIYPSPGGPLESLFRSVPDLRFFHLPYLRTRRARFVVEMARCLREVDARGVICYPFGLHLLVALAANSLPRCRSIVHVGNPPALTGPGRTMFRAIMIASHWLNTPLWSCSQTVHDQLSALASPLPPGSRAVPNGVNIQSLKEAALRGSRTRTIEGPVVAMTARLDAIKDHDTLLRAFVEVAKVRPGTKLWVIGDGNLRETLERQVAALGLGAVVSFLGVQQQVGELLGQTDVFVFSTTGAEGFGIAVAEAMALGLPIVATDVSACREVLDGGRCGVLVPPRDPQALARAISDLLADPKKARLLGEAAATRAGLHYDIAHCAAEYFAFLLDDRAG
jgi:glycosyltransferase involved in cell wall biosynthesis